MRGWRSSWAGTWGGAYSLDTHLLRAIGDSQQIDPFTKKERQTAVEKIPRFISEPFTHIHTC